MPIFHLLEKCGFIKEYIGLIDTPVGVEKTWRSEKKSTSNAFLPKSFPQLLSLADQENIWENILSNGPRIYSLPNPHIQWLIKICQAPKPGTSIRKSCKGNLIPHFRNSKYWKIFSVTMCPLCANCSTWPLHQICDYTRIACMFLSNQLFFLTLFPRNFKFPRNYQFLWLFHL